MLGHKRIPSREGGVEIVVEELSSKMVANGNDVTVFNRTGHHVAGKTFDNKQLKTYKGVRIKRVLALDFKGLSAVTASIFATIRATFGKYDIIHFHAEGSCVMLWLPYFFRKHTIVTIHGLDWQRAKWKGGFGSFYIRLGEKFAVKYADEIVVLSENVKKYFWDTYKRKTIFIPNGVIKPNKVNAQLIKDFYHLDKDSYVLYLGRIVPEKGIHYLIEAFENIETKKRLVIAGGSSDTDSYLKELKDLAKGDKRIIFTGFVQGKLLEELYSNAYLYTLPSDLEGMPLSLLEAMSYGNCCLVSNIPECKEVVGKYGFTFLNGNKKDLENQLSKLLHDKMSVLKIRKEVASYVFSRYNWDKITKQYLELYDNIVNLHK